MNNKGRLNFLSVAFVFVGTIVGAGFASGREVWQFFGVFGSKGLLGIIFVGIMFVILGVMISLISLMLRTSDMGRIIVPGDNQKLTNLIGYFMAFVLFVAIVQMSSAGGALLNQQFGIHRAVGGLIIIALVIATLLGGFERMNGVFRLVMPFLIIAAVTISVAIVIVKPEQAAQQSEVVPTGMATVWWFAPIIYLSYNMLAMIPIIGTASARAKSGKQAIAGSALGGVLLCMMAFVMCKAMMTDGGYSQSLDMPMLGMSGKLGSAANLIYGLILFFATYSSATGNFYGFTTKLKDGKNKNIKMMAFAILGFGIGLIGFKNVVAYILPILGIVGIAIIILVIINFFVVVVDSLVSKQKKEKYDFPEGVINVTTGRGAASLLFVGDEKTALIDCSMAYCGDHLVDKIKKQLNGRPLDYFFASHTHYDHIGALPSLRKEWPNLIVCGAEHGQKVLQREGALKGIKKLGDEAALMNTNGAIKEVSVEGLSIDKVVHDGEVIDLGGKQIVCLETPGHTRCSLTFVVEPISLMLASESVGVLERRGLCHPAILHSYEDAINSIHKCRDYGAKRVVISHYGIVPENYNAKLWKILEREARVEKELIEQAWDKGMSEDEILEMMIDRYWCDYRQVEQPLDAFCINMLSTIRLYKKDRK